MYILLLQEPLDELLEVNLTVAVCVHDAHDGREVLLACGTFLDRAHRLQEHPQLLRRTTETRQQAREHAQAQDSLCHVLPRLLQSSVSKVVSE